MPDQNESEVLRLLKKALRWTREANTDETLRAAIALLDGGASEGAKQDAGPRRSGRKATKKTTKAR